jgi:multimeric flavodoxin WrbA
MVNKKIVGIVASPRKGANTDTIVQEVLDGAKEAGAQTVKYYLNDLKYVGCQACMYCKQHKECRIDDDAKKILNEIKSAEAVVFGVPMYFLQFNGQFRLFEDRMYSFMGTDFKPNWPGTKAVIVVSQGNPSPSMSSEAIEKFKIRASIIGLNVVETIVQLDGNKPNAAKEYPDILQKATATGKALVA